MRNEKQAITLFREGHSCSQAILCTYASRFGLENDIAYKIASGFGGGIGRTGKTCGTVSAAIMLIGLSQTGDDKEHIYKLSQDFIDCFISKNASIECNELLGHDIRLVEERKIIKEKNLRDKVCVKAVFTASKILEEMLFPEKS